MVGAPVAANLARLDPKHVSTPYAERRKPTMRMHMRRFTRLTTAFSRAVEHHVFERIHNMRA